MRSRAARCDDRMSQRDALPTDASLYEHGVSDVAPAERGVLSVPPCAACDCREARPRFEIEGFPQRVAVCNDCGLGFLHPMPDPDTIRAFYPNEYYGEPGVKFQPLVERLVRAVGARHISFLSAGVPPGARVLDVGCGR